MNRNNEIISEHIFNQTHRFEKNLKSFLQYAIKNSKFDKAFAGKAHIFYPLDSSFLKDKRDLKIDLVIDERLKLNTLRLFSNCSAKISFNVLINDPDEIVKLFNGNDDDENKCILKLGNASDTFKNKFKNILKFNEDGTVDAESLKSIDDVTISFKILLNKFLYTSPSKYEKESGNLVLNTDKSIFDMLTSIDGTVEIGFKVDDKKIDSFEIGNISFEIDSSGESENEFDLLKYIGKSIKNAFKTTIKRFDLLIVYFNSFYSYNTSSDNAKKILHNGDFNINLIGDILNNVKKELADDGKNIDENIKFDIGKTEKDYIIKISYESENNNDLIGYISFKIK